MNRTVLSRAAEVTLKARMRGQFAALRSASPSPRTNDDALLAMADPSKIRTRTDAETAVIRGDLALFGRLPCA